MNCENFLVSLGFIGDYIKIVRPLIHLIKDPDKGKNNRKTSSDGIRRRNGYRELHRTWNSEHQQAFERIIEVLTAAPILSFADQKLPLLLHTTNKYIYLAIHKSDN